MSTIEEAARDLIEVCGPSHVRLPPEVDDAVTELSRALHRGGLPERYSEDPDERIAAIRSLEAELNVLLGREEWAQAHSTAYELERRLDADIYMRRRVEDRRDR